MSSASPELVKEMQLKVLQLQKDLKQTLEQYKGVSACVVFEMTIENNGVSGTSMNEFDYNVTPARKLGMAEFQALAVREKLRHNLSEVVAPQAPVVKLAPK